MLEDREPSVTATERELKFEACAAELVVTPVAIDTVQYTCEVMVAVAAVRVRVDVTVPVLDPTAVNVVVPQPVWVVASEEATPNIGRTTMIMSLGARGTLTAKEKVIAEGADTTWLATVRRLWTIAGDGSTTALEYMIDEEAMLLASARTTAIVREAKFALCADAHVVTPVFI